MRLFTLVFNIAITVNCYGRGEFPIYGGRLVSDLNGGGFSITNLAPGFAGSIGALTNAALFATPEDVAAVTSGVSVAESDPIAYPVATNALARLKQLEQYGDASIVPSPDGWFEFSGGEITGLNWEAGRTNVVIPYAIGGVPVARIGASVFKNISVTSVIAPKTVTSTGLSTFYGCTVLTSVSLPMVTSASNGAFFNCTVLTSVSLPMATSVVSSAFTYCAGLTSVSLPMVTSVGNNAFTYCAGLTSLSLPMVTSVGNNVFNGCLALTSITLGKTPPTWGAGTVESATIYVPHDAVGYSDTFEGMPVIRATESAANFYLGGKTLEDRFGEKAGAETIYTGAVCPASSGTQYYWTTGTNVTLSVGTLTAGKPVNIAKLNNTATNSITAIGAVGWVWTGGEMTNTITAGKSMTFGFLVDPSNGKTNAYATGVSK